MKLRKKLYLWWLWIACMLIILPMIVGCSGNALPSNETSSTFLKLLKLQPGTAISTAIQGHTYIVMNDFAKVRDIYGIPLPTSNDESDIENYTMAIFDADHSLATPGPGFSYTWGSGFDTHYLQEPAYSIRSNNVGYSPSDVDASIESEIGLGLIGNFNPQATQTDFNQKTGWPQWVKDNYITENYQNVTINSWGDASILHLLDRFAPPDLDQLGRAHPLAVMQTNVFFSSTAANIKSMIDANVGKSTSMADDPKYASVAKGLSELGAYSAIINDDIIGPGLTNFDALKKSDMGTAPLLQPYVALGFGEGKDGKGVYLAVVLVYNNKKSATDNARILQTRIEQGLYTNGIASITWKQTFTDSQISVEGNMILTKLYGSILSQWGSPETIPFSYPLFLHE
jgi:hypothetical protein